MAKKEEVQQLIVNNDPKSTYSEAIRSIRTNLQFSSINRDLEVLLITSPEPGDGKSFTSANLAAAYAQDGKKVLIIDCDLRKGRQHRIFGIGKDATKGYSNLILNYDRHIDVTDYVEKTNVKNVFLIPNGPTPPNPIELLASTKNKDLLSVLKNMFDIIILDCPPVLGLSDALVMTRYSDANIVVTTIKKTKMESLKEVQKSMEKVNAKITGVILNKATAKKSSYYYGY